MKLVAALWDPDHEALLAPSTLDALAGAGATGVRVNLDDQPAHALRLQAFEAPVGAVVWLDAPDEAPLAVLAGLTGVAGKVAAWEVEERVPMAPPDEAVPGSLAQVVFLRRPETLPYADWLAHWHGPHTAIAMETQATFGYVQARVVRPIGDAPAVDAVVEELFPPGALDDPHVFYGSGGSDEELTRRLGRLMESVATMGADRDLDVVPTTRHVLR